MSLKLDVGLISVNLSTLGGETRQAEFFVPVQEDMDSASAHLAHQLNDPALTFLPCRIDDQTYLVRSDAIGHAAARNVCFEHARGELIVWLDADDGSKTIFRFLHGGYTGHVSESGLDRYHGPGRAPANAVNALLDAHRLSGERRYLAKAEELMVLDKAAVKEPKTGGLRKKLDKLGLANALIIDGAELDENFGRAASNLPGIDLLPVQGINVYDVLRCRTLVLTKAAVEALEERFK